MQFNTLSALFIFLGSYLPLSVILAIHDIPESWWKRDLCTSNFLECVLVPFTHPSISIGFTTISALSLILGIFTLKKIRYKHDIKIIESKKVSGDIINYVFPYIVAFIAVDYSSISKILGFVSFLLLMFFLTHKSGNILMNPLLLLFNWHLYEAKIEIRGQEQNARVLTKSQLKLGQVYKSQKLQEFYIIDRNKGTE